MQESMRVANASAVVSHYKLKPGYTPRLIDSPIGPVPDPEAYEVVTTETITNLKTLAGIDHVHLQAYGSSGLSTNGFNYIGLSNDTLTETSASTTLSNEIAANGLTRAQGTVTHTAGTTLTTVQRTFTATGVQSARKCALFTQASGGVMNHVLAFSAQRNLDSGDTLQVTVSLTVG